MRPDEAHKPKPRTCPHCGKDIPTLPKKPRDLGLLLNVLLYRVPIEAEITEGWIETARKHCRMKPERLAELRAGFHARHWPRMIERRAARLAYFKQHGELPPRWAGLLAGEPDHYEQLAGMHRYRKDGLAKMKAQLRRHPDKMGDKLTNRYLATKRIRSAPRKSAALDAVMAQMTAHMGAQAGKLNLRKYEALKSVMLTADATPRRFRKKPPGGVGLSAETPGKNAGGELEPQVPRLAPDGPHREGQT
jgi:hypothetical protein